MSLPRTSFTLRRLLLEPIVIYTPCTPAIRHVVGAAHCQLTTRRRPWAHQSRFASNDPPRGAGKEEKDPYKVLGVPNDIPQESLQKAFYAKAKKHHPDASKGDRTKFQEIVAAYEEVRTREARSNHDAKVRRLERARLAQLARDVAATMQTSQTPKPRPEPAKGQTSSGGPAKFISRASLNWIKKHLRAKQEAEAEAEAQKKKDQAAQRERDLASQRIKDWAAQMQREILQRQDKERRDREAATRDSDKAKEPDQTRSAKGGTTSPGNRGESEPKGRLRTGPRGDAENDASARGKTISDDNNLSREGTPHATAQKSTVSPKSELSRVAIFSVGAGASIEDVVKSLASSAIGRLALIQVTQSGTAKLDFSTADAAHKLHRVMSEGKFMVNQRKIRGMTLHVSVLPIPQDPHASRVLVLTDPRDDKMPVLDSKHVKFILRQEGHNCHWVEVRHLSRTRTEVHFSSIGEAEQADQILQNLFPGIQTRYGIDPATGSKESGSSFLKWNATGEDLPDTLFPRAMRGVFFVLLSGCCCILIHDYYTQ
ncbi:mitochondrial DnaJ chaperone [Diaporthe helianthi]|uniref:Mitochondrial DnaJ chaperone n=1 Tax=Diaporthe helianthi TaxID=158607 RepID=A0A2P5HEV6_DIAHE|nr:mitochondrial DnaJ chaperone [Diaporthe helianthi]